MGESQMTEGLAQGELSGRVALVPGLIETERGESAGLGAPEHHAKNKTLSGLKGRTEDVADLVVFLCGPKARYITGQTLHATGGAYFS